MKAIVHTEYGSPDVLQLLEVHKPVPEDNQVLVKVHAASLNAADLETLRGIAMVRIASPRRPMYRIPGSDIAGQVEAVGNNVTEFQAGDEVYADLSTSGFGAFAEFVCIPENVLTLKPQEMTFEQAAAYPQAAVVALQALREAPMGLGIEHRRHVQAGHKVLINGAGGGMGTFAVQIAKHYGARVDAVDSLEKLDSLRSIGADHVIDFKQEDYTARGERYDLILDVAAHRSITAYNRALRADGKFVLIGGSTSSILQVLILGQLLSRTSRKAIGMNSWTPNKKEDLQFLAELFINSQVVPIIDRNYPLSRTADAFRYLEEEPHFGKIIIKIANNDNE